ncbi:MAG: lipase [Oscillospiraceae bacterium]
MAFSIPENKKLIAADDACFQYMGRIDFDDKKRPVMVWPASCADTVFTGTSLSVVVNNRRFQETTHFAVIIDGVMQKVFMGDSAEDEMFTVAENLEDKPHTLRILKTLAAQHYLTFIGIVVDEGASASNPCHKYDCKLEVYGDSVSAGEVTELLYYEGQCDPEGHNNRYDNSHFSYPSALSRKLNAELHDIAQGGIALLDGTGFFCADNLKGMVSCFDKIQYSPYAPTKQWDFSRFTPDFVIIAIGQNDHNPDPERIKTPEFRAYWKGEYIKLLSSLMEKYPNAQFVLMLTVLRHDTTWDDALEEITREVNSARVTHFKFRRNGDATNGHPRATEQEEMAGELYTYLKDKLPRR